MKKNNKKEVAEILGVHIKSLSRWHNEKIKYELAKECYKVTDIVKEGRSIYFYVMYEEYSQSNDEHLKDVFKVKDIESLKRYTKRKAKSIEKEELINRSELCKETNIAETTSKRYDTKLIEKGVFEKLDDVLYICVDKSTRKRVLVDGQAYNNYWIKNSAINKELKSLRKRFSQGELSINDYNYLRDIILSKSETPYMYYKVNKLVVKYDNYLYKMLIEGEENPLLFLLIDNICGLAI